MRQVNSRFLAQDAYSRYEKLKRRTTAAAILLLVLVAGGLAWVFVPQPAMASMFDWSKPAAIPTLYTGASFSVTIASVDSADGANVAASRVRSLGMPAFTRRSPGKDQVYQTMVGPFASLDEAEKAQRNLGSLGYRAARIFVDESLRTTPRGDQPIVDTAAANPGILLLGAPDRVSLVFEMQSEPRQVSSSRPDGTTVQIDAGPMPTPAQPQQWSAPEGVHLLHTVSIESLSAQGGLNYVLYANCLAGVCEGQRAKRRAPRVCRPDMAARRRERARTEAHDGHSRGRSRSCLDARPGRKCAGKTEHSTAASGRAVSPGDRADPPAHPRGASVPAVRCAVRIDRRLRGARSDVRGARSVADQDHRAAVRGRTASVAAERHASCQAGIRSCVRRGPAGAGAEGARHVRWSDGRPSRHYCSVVFRPACANL